MLLSDPSYFYFLVLTVLAYYGLKPGSPRRVLLLAASYFFYLELAGGYLAILLLVTLLTYFGARKMQAVPAESGRGWFFWGLIVVVLLPLLSFKYTLPVLAGVLHADAEAIILPIGISFFTFVALGYLIDVYLEVVEPEPDFVRVALLLAFFPLVSSGPIERASRLMPQFELDNHFSADSAFVALRLILVGLILKLCFTGYLLFPANSVFSVPTNYPPICQLMGPIFYAFGLYSDFLGYSLIAIGSARLFGLQVLPNFRQPFLSTSVPEYWRCWHISLSSWVRDYLFTPLRMEWRRRGNLGMAAALTASMIIIGVWHGAKWGYVLFGLLHGIYVSTSALTKPRRDAFWTSIGVPLSWLYVPRMLATFFFVLMAFILFRANSLSDALVLYRGIFSYSLIQNFAQTFNHYLLHTGPMLDYRLTDLSQRWIYVLLLLAGDILVRNKISLETVPRPAQSVLCVLGVLTVATQWIDFNVAVPFQYYKF